MNRLIIPALALATFLLAVGTARVIGWVIDAIERGETSPDPL